MLGLHRRQEHPVTVQMDFEGSENSENLQAYVDKLLILPRDRREKLRVYDSMDTFDLVMAVLDVYAEEATQRDYDRGVTAWVESKDPGMITAGEECFRNLQIESRIPQITRNVAKYGDEIRRLMYATGKGVLGWKQVHPTRVHRLDDKYARLIGFREDGQKYRGKLQRNVSWPWDYVHFRLLGSGEELYGTSVLEALFRPWRQLALAEDSVLMYRMRRAPDRNLILVDVGNMEEAESQQFLNAWRKKFRKYEFVDPASPNYKKQYNPLTPLEDIFIAMRKDNQTRIETMSGAGNMGELYDLEHFRNKFFGTAKVPKAYFGFEGEINAKATLTQQDVRFARTMKRLQRAGIYGLRQVLEFHYSLLPSNPEDTSYDFTKPEHAFMVQMPPISYLDEWERLELVELRYRIVDAMSRIASEFKLDPRVWAIYVLLNYAKLPEDLVQKLITQTTPAADPGAGGFESLPPRLKRLVEGADPKTQKYIREDMKPTGYYSLSDTEQKLLAEAVHSSPALRRIIGDITYFHEGDTHAASLQQVDPSILPVTSRGEPLQDSCEDDAEAKSLREDLETIRQEV